MEKINIAQLLKDCPKGMELYSPLCGDCKLYSVNDYNITIEIPNRDSLIILRHDGTYCVNGEIMLFPKCKTTWEGFVPPCELKKESEDERMWKLIKKYVHYNISDIALNADHITREQLESWLEKQSKKPRSKSAFEAINEEKVDNQNCVKPTTDKIKPKFKVGDRIRHRVTNKDDVYEIERVYDNSYGLVGFTWMIYMKYQDQYELVPNKFDINTLVPFESKVLVRDNKQQYWYPAIWGCYNSDSGYPHIVIGGAFKYCIPYKGNEHLLSTTDDCNDFYKTW